MASIDLLFIRKSIKQVNEVGRVFKLYNFKYFQNIREQLISTMASKLDRAHMNFEISSFYPFILSIHEHAQIAS